MRTNNDRHRPEADGCAGESEGIVVIYGKLIPFPGQRRKSGHQSGLENVSTQQPTKPATKSSPRGSSKNSTKDSLTGPSSRSSMFSDLGAPDPVPPLSRVSVPTAFLNSQVGRSLSLASAPAASVQDAGRDAHRGAPAGRGAGMTRAEFQTVAKVCLDGCDGSARDSRRLLRRHGSLATALILLGYLLLVGAISERLAIATSWGSSLLIVGSLHVCLAAGLFARARMFHPARGTSGGRRW